MNVMETFKNEIKLDPWNSASEDILTVVSNDVWRHLTIHITTPSSYSIWYAVVQPNMDCMFQLYPYPLWAR